MKRSTICHFIAATAAMTQTAQAHMPKTYCNPVDLPYRFCLVQPSRREAADPTMVVFDNKYWLFASKFGGYLWTVDFVDWNFVQPTGLPIEDYAPTVVVVGGNMYYTAGSAGIYRTADPAAGAWTKASDTAHLADPDLFLDDDGKIYLYSGCSDGGPIVGQELDLSFHPIGERVDLVSADVAHHGGEILAEPDAAPPYNPKTSWIEGPWMMKHGGKYFLEYAAPGTEFKAYNDSIYVADSPLGPFTFAPYSPFSFKPTGFIAGAGHSSSFQDLGGRYWHIATMTISVRHSFERRLGLFPMWYTHDNQAVCDTYLGDYPQYLPGQVKDPSKGNSPGWMLLDYKKPATASSTLDGHPASDAVNEDIRTWWSATSGNPGEWLQVDMGKPCRVNAVQINFADQGSTQLGRLTDGYGYTLEVSVDGQKWSTIVDRSVDRKDSPHDYTELDKPVTARYARLTNTHTPAGALFSVSGLRLFGSGVGMAPAVVKNVEVSRNASDQRQASIRWDAVDGADGYIVRYGIAPDRLFSNYQVYGATSLDIHTLNVGVDYYFAVDSFNDTGVTRGHPTPKDH